MAMTRIEQLHAVGMRFDDPPSEKVNERIDALSDTEFKELLAMTPKLSTPDEGPTLFYQDGGGFQLRSGGDE